MKHKVSNMKIIPMSRSEHSHRLLKNEMAQTYDSSLKALDHAFALMIDQYNQTVDKWDTKDLRIDLHLFPRVLLTTWVNPLWDALNKVDTHALSQTLLNIKEPLEQHPLFKTQHDLAKLFNLIQGSVTIVRNCQAAIDSEHIDGFIAYNNLATERYTIFMREAAPYLKPVSDIDSKHAKFSQAQPKEITPLFSPILASAEPPTPTTAASPKPAPVQKPARLIYKPTTFKPTKRKPTAPERACQPDIVPTIETVHALLNLANHQKPSLLSAFQASKAQAKRDETLTTGACTKAGRPHKKSRTQY